MLTVSLRRTSGEAGRGGLGLRGRCERLPHAQPEPPRDGPWPLADSHEKEIS